MNIPEKVNFIISTLESAGFEAYIVGGCVRDIIRGEAPLDWDITSSALPSQVKALFSRTFDTGIKHGTITVLLGKERFEVTTYRVDGEYFDNRRPETVTFTSKIEEDLSRRDFTVNAIAYNPKHGFADPFDGRGDIEKGIIRCVGDAESRFGEDALRMLRAIRFSAVLGFSVDEAAVRAITKLRENITFVSAERIREELSKLLLGKNLNALLLSEQTGLLYYALRRREIKDLQTVIERLSAIPPDETMRLALFFSRDCENILRDLRFDNKTIKTVSLYVQYLREEILPDRFEIKKFLRVFPLENFEKLLILKETVFSRSYEKIREEARDIVAKKECFTFRDLAVNGDDLIRLGFSGKAIGDKLEKLLQTVMRDPSMNSREKLLCL